MIEQSERAGHRRQFVHARLDALAVDLPELRRQIALHLVFDRFPVVIARAGLTGDLETPVVEVTSYTATAVLGLIALGGGFVLLLAGLARSRAGVIFVSVILAVAAATLVIEPGTAERTLAGERDFGIAGLIVLGLVALVAVLAPDVDRVARRERID